MASIRIQATPRGMTLRLNGRDITSLIDPGGTSIEWRDGVPVVTFRVADPEFTLRADDYAALGGYASRAVSLEDVLRGTRVRIDEPGP